jgi:hypothetical protein
MDGDAGLGEFGRVWVLFWEGMRYHLLSFMFIMDDE